MAKVRQARRCRARSKRTGEPCRAYAVLGATVCRMHGGAITRVRVAAAQRREREAIERAMHRLEERHAQQMEAWLAERIEVAADLLRMEPEKISPEDLRRCCELYGRTNLDDPPPRPRLDLRAIPRGPVVIRRRR